MTILRNILKSLSILFIAAGTASSLFSLHIFGLSEVILQLLYATGLLLYCTTHYNKWKIFSPKSMIGTLAIGLIPLGVSDLRAQPNIYQKQISALEKGFTEKNIEYVQPYISPQLKFLSYPATATEQILKQVFTNMPALESITILESGPGEVQVRYEFSAIGKRTSGIVFDESNQITKIELIDKLLEEQQKAQKALQNSVQQPTPGKDYPPQKVSFPSKDGLMVVGHLYETDPESPILLLCHQANMNKFEYAGIAPKLNALGYNVLAIDLRSGGSFAGHPNGTFNNANAKGLDKISYADAYQDIEAAVDYLAHKFGKKVTVWGSSYSSSLALLAALKHDDVKAAIAFSPGDYFGDQIPLLQTTLQKLEKPFLITSSQEEAEELAKTMDQSSANERDGQIQFIPESKGFHGARALWEGQDGANEYWTAINSFLLHIYPE